MMPIERLPAPDFLTGNFEKWGLRYEQRRARNPAAKFFWPVYQKTRINLLLLPDLMAMTAEHCTFCDGFPIETTGDSIEHFIPVTKEPKLAYQWENLFYCCLKCQASKGEGYSEKLLRPDVDGYSFDHYFQYDTKTGKIIPNIDREHGDQQRAEKTIELYGLNQHGRPKARRRTLKMFVAGLHQLTDFPYRFILL
jgi:uncharacterized protein (TIGR02646 family)